MNWNEATLEQCWKFLPPLVVNGVGYKPSSPTLDYIEASLPEDCVWSEIEWIDGSNEWKSTARKSGSQCRVHAYADIEILSRARCACPLCVPRVGGEREVNQVDRAEYTALLSGTCPSQPFDSATSLVSVKVGLVGSTPTRSIPQRGKPQEQT